MMEHDINQNYCQQGACFKVIDYYAHTRPKGEPYSFKIETTVSLQLLEERLVLLAAKEIEVCNLKIAPVVAQIPGIAMAIPVREPAHQAAKRPGDPGWGDACEPERGGRDVLGLLPV